MEEKKYGTCPECVAPCEITEGAYKEEFHDVHYVEHKYKPSPGAVWVTGQYDKLYDQVKGGKRTVCYVDSGSCRDICTVKDDYLEFTARGIGYGWPRSRFDKTRNEKESFIELCEEMNVEWLCDGAAATVPILSDDQFPDLSNATPEVKAQTINELVELCAKNVLKMFYAFGLKTHIECTVVNDPTNETFDFIFRKRGADPLTQQRADLIREANNRDMGGTAGREEDAVTFHDWVLANEWEINNLAEHTHSTTELYELFKQKKERR